MLKLAFLTTTLLASSTAPGQNTDDRTRAAQEARAKEVYMPSASHDRLARLSGTWDQEVEYAIGTGKTVRASGRVRNRTVLGGRFVVSEGVARQAGGPLDVESIFIFGFDGRTREHTVVLLDSIGTYYVTAAGRVDDDSRIVMKGETPEHGGMKQYDIVLRWIDSDTYRTEIVFHFPGREPLPAVAATYRRVREDGGGPR